MSLSLKSSQKNSVLKRLRVGSGKTPDHIIDAMSLAYMHSSSSKDPSTQLGAVVVAKANVIGSKDPTWTFTPGINRFPKNTKYTEERLNTNLKYEYMEHAERDALDSYTQKRFINPHVIYSQETMVAPWFSCAGCARRIINAGIKEVVGHLEIFEFVESVDHQMSWESSIHAGFDMFEENGINFYVISNKFNDLNPVRVRGQMFTP